MSFLASLKKNLAQYKEPETITYVITVPFAELRHDTTNSNINNNNISSSNETTLETLEDCKTASEEEDQKVENTAKSVHVICISDIHMRLKELRMPAGDKNSILVLSGDFTNDGTIAEAIEVNEWLGRIVDECGYKHVVCTAGNHEGYGNILIDQMQFAKTEEERIKKMNDLRQLMTNVTHFLYHESAVIEGIKFWGSPLTPNLTHPQDKGNIYHIDHGLHMCPTNIAKVWKKIPNDVQYLITHGPPQGILDINGKGCSMLRLEIARLKELKCHQFGHVHMGYGWKYITKKSLVESVADIVIADGEEPSALREITKLGKDLVSYAYDESGKNVENAKQLKSDFVQMVNQNVDIMNDVALFINAATDGCQQAIEFHIPL